MAGNEQFDDSITRWLQETAPDRLPQRVLAATFERTHRTRQDPDWRAILGRRQMPRLVPALGTAAAVVLAAVLALNLGLISAPGGTPSPSATTLPSATPPRPAAFLPTARPAEPPADWIAYQSGNDILAVDVANPDHTVVIGRLVGADPIAWAPDGTKLLVGNHPDVLPVAVDGDWGIPTPPAGLFVLHADGSKNVIGRSSGNPIGAGTLGREIATWGTFSPDGTNVAYACCGGAPGPYIVGADGSGLRSLLGETCDSPGCGEPLPEWAAWSPVSSEIAWIDFWENHPTFGHHALVLSFVRADGTGLREAVVQLPGEAGGLTWSPDGLRLAFWGLSTHGDKPTEGLPAQIYVVNADGSGLRQLTDTDDNRWPSWSPDGTRIAFARGQVRLLTFGNLPEIEYIAPDSRTLHTMASDGSDVVSFDRIHPEGPIAWAPVP